MAVRNPWQMKLIQNLQGKEAQTAGLQRRRALNAGNLEAGPAALNVMADVARNFQANRQQAELTKSMQLDAESREAVARRDKAFSQAMQMYRGGLPVPQELASEAGMPGLTKIPPKAAAVREVTDKKGNVMRWDPSAGAYAQVYGIDPNDPEKRIPLQRHIASASRNRMIKLPGNKLGLMNVDTGDVLPTDLDYPGGQQLTPSSLSQLNKLLYPVNRRNEPVYDAGMAAQLERLPLHPSFTAYVNAVRDREESDGPPDLSAMAPGSYEGQTAALPDGSTAVWKNGKWVNK